jgi:hypothetical protein
LTELHDTPALPKLIRVDARLVDFSLAVMRFGNIARRKNMVSSVLRIVSSRGHEETIGAMCRHLSLRGMEVIVLF